MDGQIDEYMNGRRKRKMGEKQGRKGSGEGDDRQIRVKMDGWVGLVLDKYILECMSS